MVSPLEIAIRRLVELGFFTYILPYILTSAIFYGLLRKSQIFGKPEENVAVNASVALVAAMFVWGAPLMLGIDIATALHLFFTQAVIGMLIIVVVMLVASMFGPLPEKLGEIMGKQAGWISTFIFIGVIIALAVFISSGAVGIMFPTHTVAMVPADVLTAIVIIILLIIAIAVLGWIVK